jgi:leucyl-tRNA synthetase
VEKLRLQGYVVKDPRPFTPDFSREVEVPLTRKRVPILPASFVDPHNTTGVVGSVPSHAPYDYVALLQLKRNPEELKPYGIDPQRVLELKPISLIELEGYGESPAVDVVERMEIKDQRDPRLEEATAEVYRNEFAKGKMRSWVPGYAGMPVSQAKQAVRDEMLARGEAATMHEFSARPVTCRCNTPVVIKVVEDQWFLNYADEDWKQKARECLARMHLVPPETRGQFEHTIEWLREWPCTRKLGLGTPAPWDPGWIIESLSDSTIYMAYYTISHLLKQVDVEKLDDEVFDFIFRGLGNAAHIAQAKGIDPKLLEDMRREFEYWYPLDYRMSANELIPNHLTFHIFHHARLFPEHCPRGIVSFGMAILEGQKMSSSRGNIIPINEAVRRYGADTVRLYLVSVSEPWQDMDWKAQEVQAMQRNLERFSQLAEEIISSPTGPAVRGIPERWLLSRLQLHVEETTGALEAFETRKALQHAFFMLLQDVRKYLARVEGAACREVLLQVLETWLKLLAPFAPHLCEELWRRLGKQDFISTASWPTVNTKLRDRSVEFVEEYLAKLIDDVNGIKKVLKVKPRRACIYVAQDWKWEAYRMAISHFIGKVDFGKLLREVEEKLGLKLHKSDLAKMLQQMLTGLRKLPPETLEALGKERVNEYSVLQESIGYLSKRTGLEISVFRADDPSRYDPAGRAKHSLPLRPALYLE